MIDLRGVSVWPGERAERVLRDVELHIPESSWTLLAGPTGSGKSTLLRTICGLTPFFTGGRVDGEVSVAGRPVRAARPRGLADVIGYVGQDVSATFVADTVEDDVAWALESLGTDPVTMRRRVEDTLELMDLVELRRRPLGSLSGGQQQRVAIAAALATSPRVLLLDEPTSALDPAAADDVLAALHRVVDEISTTVVMAEHRLERVLHLVDDLAVIDTDGAVEFGPVSAMVDQLVDGPPLLELARRCGWSPPPLAVRAARQRAVALALPIDASGPARRSPGREVAVVRRLGLAYGTRVALRNVDFTAHAGQVCVVMGRNGAGKSSLCRALVGLSDPTQGSVVIDGADVHSLRPRDRVARAALVPQDHRVLLDGPTIGHDLAAADRRHSRPAGTAAAIVNALADGVALDSDPRDLSEGQALIAALAVVLAGTPALVVLDEPTRGLDYRAKRRFVETIGAIAEHGRAVVVVTHDVELAALAADRVVVLADGELIDDGEAGIVLARSAGFGPQVARVFAPRNLLTVDEAMSLVPVAPLTADDDQGTRT